MTGALQATIAKLLAKHQSYRQAQCHLKKNKSKELKLMNLLEFLFQNNLDARKDMRDLDDRKTNEIFFVFIV